MQNGLRTWTVGFGFDFHTHCHVLCNFPAAQIVMSIDFKVKVKIDNCLRETKSNNNSWCKYKRFGIRFFFYMYLPQKIKLRI